MGSPLPNLPTGMTATELVDGVILKVTCPDGQELFSGEPAKISTCMDNNWTAVYDQCGPGKLDSYGRFVQ